MQVDRLLEHLRRDDRVLRLLVDDDHDGHDQALPPVLEERDDDDGNRTEGRADVGDQIGDGDEEGERRGERDVEQHHGDVDAEARDHRDEELAVPVRLRGVVDSLRRPQEPRPAFGTEAGADATAYVSAVDHEVDREHEDHEAGERSAGERPDGAHDRADPAEELRDVLGRALGRLDLILGADALDEARALEALGVLGDRIGEVLRTVDDRRDDDQPDNEEDQGQEEQRESDSGALADLRPAPQGLRDRVDREGEEGRGEDPGDDRAGQQDHSEQCGDQEDDADDDGRVVGKLAPPGSRRGPWQSLALTHVTELRPQPGVSCALPARPGWMMSVDRRMLAPDDREETNHPRLGTPRARNDRDPRRFADPLGQAPGARHRLLGRTPARSYSRTTTFAALCRSTSSTSCTRTSILRKRWRISSRRTSRGSQARSPELFASPRSKESTASCNVRACRSSGRTRTAQRTRPS